MHEFEVFKRTIIDHDLVDQTILTAAYGEVVAERIVSRTDFDAVQINGCSGSVVGDGQMAPFVGR